MTDIINNADVMFRLITEGAPYAIAVANEKGEILLVNSRMAELFGYQREEMVGQTIEMLVPDRFRAKHVTDRQQFHERPEIRPMGTGRDLYGLKKDGDAFPVEIGLNSIRTPDGLLVFAAISDISLRKRSEDALRQSEARLNLALSAAHAGTWDWDMTDDQATWSEESYLLFGLKPEDGRPSYKLWLSMVHPDDRAAVQGRVKTLINEYTTQPMHETFDLEYRIVRSDGAVRWVNDRGQILYDRDNRPARMIGIVIDVTERKLVEERLARQAQELERSNAELQEFAYVASHDLQEPLRAVAGCVEILRRRYQGTLDARADEIIRHAVDGSARMQNLINDLLAYSRVGSRDQPFELADSNAALRSALANLEVAITESGTAVTHDQLPKIVADQAQLAQLFQNLIGNAIKFHGSHAPVIHIGVERKKDEWRFSVSDNGIGIEPQYLERIFHIFQRLHGRAAYPGTGIGLAICKRIVERHGGRIWGESQPGEGSTFHFTFPIRT